jgi:putative selenate reductase molybdopterin-binding subunit
MKRVTQSIKKVDSYGLIRGQGVYSDDLSPKNSLVLKVLRSPHAFAEIVDIDTSEAEKLDGVIKVYTYKNF